MASFTDIIPQFTPYVQQVPVQALVEVGMEKQRRYDEGIQKIQASIDNVAGLAVVRDIDKAYLQSKLNELGGKLKSVAAGDFSNFQLVNSVGGMANQIVKDPVVQNAVASTERYKKELALAETYRKEGKSSANREWDFAQSVNEWLNSKDPSKSFSGSFKQHIDVNKKVMDTLKQINPNIKESDMPYAIDKRGNIKWGEIAAAMQRTSVKEVTEGQIRTAINAVLDANDLDELASQGRYNYRNYNENDLRVAATENYKTERDTSKFRLEQLKSQLLSTTDIGQQAEINSAIEYYEDRLAKLDDNFNNLVQTIPTDPNAARSQLYTRNWLDQIGNAFAYREIKDQVVSNPLREDFWKQKNFELDQLKEANQQKWKTLEYQMDVERLNIERAKLQAENAPGTPFYVGSGDETLDAVNSLKNYNDYNGAIRTQNDGILSDLVSQNSSINRQANPRDILKNIENYKLGKYKPRDNYEKQQFDQYIKNSNTLANQKAIYEKFENEAYQEITGGKGTLSQSLSQQLQKANGIRITLANGTTTTFSPKEIHDYMKKEKSKVVGKAGAIQLSVDPETLTEREKVLYNTIKARYQGSSVAGAKSTGNSAVDAALGKIAPVAAKNAAIQSEITRRVALKMAPITGAFRTEQTGIEFKDNTAKGNFVSSLSNIVQADLKQKVGGKDYEPADVLATLTKGKLDDVDFQLRRKGGDYVLQVTDKSSGETSMVPVSAEFVARNKNLGTSFLNTNLDLADALLRNAGSTNIFKDYTHAQYSTGLIGSQLQTGTRTVTLPVAADLEARGGEVYPVFRMMTKKGQVDLYLPNPTDKGAFESTYLPSLTNDKIIRLFKTQYPNIEQLINQ